MLNIRPSTCNFTTPQPLPDTEQIMVTKFLGTYISATLSATVHVEQILSVASQRLFLLQQLKSQGLSHHDYILFSVLLFSPLSCVICRLSQGQLSAGDKELLDGLFCKAFKHVL